MAGDIQQFDFSVDVLRSLLWQYDSAESLQGILNAKNDWYLDNHTGFWANWYRDVFNLETANDFGLNVWAIILGQNIYVNSSSSILDKVPFGFGDDHANFNNGNFASDTGTTYQLPTESARILLRLRYFQLTSVGAVPEINRMLKYVFKNYGLAYVEDNLDMTMRYVFTFPLNSDLLYIFNNFDVLPRPAGVGSTFIQGDVKFFGFGEPHANFENGNFGA